jgi:hypothetical protein
VAEVILGLRADEGFMSMDEEREKILHQLLASHFCLGKNKPMSYLPIQTIENTIGMSVAQYVQMAESKGLVCRIFSPEETYIKSGAVYLYDPKEIRLVLLAHNKLLAECDWPSDPALFVCRIAKAWLEDGERVMPVVQAAFGDNGH